MAQTKTVTKIDAFIDNKFSKIQQKHIVIIIFLAILLPVALFYFLSFKPYISKISLINKQIQTLKDEISKAKKISSDLPRHKKELEEVKSTFESTSALLPKGQEIPNLLRNISDLGKNAGLDFITFTPGQEIPKDFYAEIPIDITIKGPYHNMGSFLDKVSKLDRIVTLDNITIDKPEQEGVEMLLNSSCKLLTYRFTNVKLESKEGKAKNTKSNEGKAKSLKASEPGQKTNKPKKP